MKVRVPMYAVVLPSGEVLNCWTSPNRLYDTRPAAVRVRNQFLAEAKERLTGSDTRFRQLPSDKKRRQDYFDRINSSKVLMVYIEVAEQNDPIK